MSSSPIAILGATLRDAEWWRERLAAGRPWLRSADLVTVASPDALHGRLLLSAYVTPEARLAAGATLAIRMIRVRIHPARDPYRDVHFLQERRSS